MSAQSYKILSFAVAALTVVNSACSNNENIDFNKVIGSNDIIVNSEYYHDFIGISQHSELFYFHEYILDARVLNDAIKLPIFMQLPNFNSSKNIKNTATCVNIKWSKTPIRSVDYKYFNGVAGFKNLLDDKNSKDFIEKDYINLKGNYYSYFSCYPFGNIFYVLVPAEGKLFVVRKRG